MGDFNADPEKFDLKYTNNTCKPSSKYKIIETLRNLDLYDTQSLMESNQQSHTSTWYGIIKKGQNINSRIDQIWISYNLLQFRRNNEILTLDDPQFDTDHALLTLKLSTHNLIDFPNPASDRHTGKTRKVFDHDRMTKKDWIAFNDEIDRLILLENLFNKYSSINSSPNQNAIDNLWTDCLKIIDTVKQSHGKWKNINRQQKRYPEASSSRCFSHLKTFLMIRKILFTLPDNLDLDTLSTLIDINFFEEALKLNDLDTNLTSTLINSSATDRNNSLNSIISKIRLRIKSEEISRTTEQINIAIEK